MITNPDYAIFQKTLDKIRRDGLKHFVDAATRTSLRYIFDHKDCSFDARRNVYTDAIIRGAHLDDENLRDEVHHHEFTPVSILDRIFRIVPDKLEEYVFIDVGAGLGKVMFYACEHPFKRVVGIEISSELCSLCRENISRYRPVKRSPKLPKPEIVQVDATTFEFPDDKLLVYMFNPFGPQTVHRFMQHLEAHYRQSGKKIYLAYYNPRYSNIIEQFSFLKPLHVPPPVLYISTYSMLALGAFETVSS